MDQRQTDEYSRADSPQGLSAKKHPAMVQIEPEHRRPIISFMQLPVELRRHIYSYLVPNVAVVVENRHHPWGNVLRKDGDRCYPALLRTNRKIYYEFVEQWYSSTWYHLLVTRSVIRFSNRNKPLTLDLPWGLRCITRLFLTVRLESPSDEKNQTTWKAHPSLDLIEKIAAFFSPSGPGNHLRELHLHITNTINYFFRMAYSEDYSSRPDWENSVRQGLESNLQSLRKIRASEALVGGELHLGMFPYNPQLRPPSFQEYIDGVVSICRGYFSLLGEEIVGDEIEPVDYHIWRSGMDIEDGEEIDGS